jgi:ribosomal protein S18 acetylase RimI-like enzyme
MCRSNKYKCATRILLLFCVVLHNTVTGWYIAPPRVNSEWEQLASVVVDCFEAPSTAALASEKIAWKLFRRPLSTQQSYRQFVQTARKMKGKKYAILIAKEGDRVVGMVELGINVDDIRGGNNHTVTESTKRATIGVVCIEAEYRRKGVASVLIDRCERIVADKWGGAALYAEVEAANLKALAFFERAGYRPLSSGCGCEQRVVTVLVRRSNKVEAVPHLLLSKTLDWDNSPEENDKTAGV